MYNVTNCSPALVNCTFSNNSADSGGGMYNRNECNPTLTGCTFSNNSALYDGGGIFCDWGSSPTLTGTTVCGNTPDQIAGSYTDNVGNCITEICDTDGDGVPDCIDPCPNWPYDCSEDGQTVYVAVGQSIQAAIDVVPDGGTIEIAAGTFQPGGTLDTGGQAMTIRGAVDGGGLTGTPTTIIDGLNAHRVLQCINSEGLDTIFENLYITGGSATDGGGMYCYDSSPTLTNCDFTDNSAYEGGGMYNESGNPTLTNCTFANNSADERRRRDVQLPTAARPWLTARSRATRPQVRAAGCERLRQQPDADRLHVHGQLVQRRRRDVQLGWQQPDPDRLHVHGQLGRQRRRDVQHQQQPDA